MKAKPKTVPGPVRAWIPFHKRGEFESEVRDAIRGGRFHEKRQTFASPDFTCRPVLILDPRTHRAVPIKRKGRK